MSETDKLREMEDGTIYNVTLTNKWERYYKAKDELEMVKNELVMESVRARAKGQKIGGMCVNMGYSSVDKTQIKKIFEEKGWEVPKKPKKVVDMKKMKEILTDKGIELPKSVVSPYAYKKK